MCLNICAMKQNRKKEFFPLFPRERANFGTTFFILLSRNVLKFSINFGGWKQYTHDAYIKDLKPVEAMMIYVTTNVVCCSMSEKPVKSRTARVRETLFCFIWIKK